MQLWDVNETAQRTKASVAFWRKQIRLRTIPVLRVGRLVRLDPEDVRAFLAARTVPAQSGQGEK